MSISLARDETRRWLVARCVSALDIDTILEFLRTARAPIELRQWPLLFDATGATSLMTDRDVERAAAMIEEVVRRGGPRAPVAIVADDDALYQWTLAYETRCAAIGVRVIRVFRRLDDAERWLAAVSSARHFMPHLNGAP